MRQLALPGVAAKDMEGAIRLQLDSLHPYGEGDISWGWSTLAPGAALVGIARQSVIDRYVALFAEAGIAVASFTFSAAAVHAAIRLNGFEAGPGFVALSRVNDRAVEVYGESDWRPVYSAEFEMSGERAAQLALAELRLAPDTPPVTLEQVLPRPSANPVENDLSRNALPYATALAGACPWLSPVANVLPVEHRRSSSRAMLAPTIVLGSLAVLLAAGMWGYARYAEHQYLESLRAEIARVQPQAQRAVALDHAIGRTARPHPPAGSVSRAYPDRSGRAQRDHAAGGTSGMEPWHRDHARRGAHQRGGAAGRAAVEDSRFFAAVSGFRDGYGAAQPVRPG